MRTVFLVLMLLNFCVQAQSLIFKGEFSQVQTTGKGCEDIFAVSEYGARFFYLPNNRNAIVHFMHEDREAFLRGVSLYGLMGYANDIVVDRVVPLGELQVKLVGEGVVSREFLLMTVKAVAKDADGYNVCQTKAEYSGFRK